MTLERAGAVRLTIQLAGRLGGSLLELGAGSVSFSRHVTATRVVSLDIQESTNPGVVGDAHRLPFRPASFDSVLASQVLEHLYRPDDAVVELARVLRPGGSLLVSVPFLYPLHSVPNDYWRFTEWGLRRLLARDFSIVEL